MKDGVVLSLSNSLESCAEYIKWKLTKTKRKWSNNKLNLLEIIHIDIYGSFLDMLMFSDCWKSSALGVFKIYK